MARITIQRIGRKPATKPATKPTAKKPVSKTSSRKEDANPRVRDYALTGLSLKGLVKSTPPFIKNNAHEVVVKQIEKAVTRAGFPAIKSKAISVGMKGKRQIYGLTVIGKEAKIPVSKQKHVLVSCQCDNFKYTWEYALHHWGSARIKYCNGEPALVTNPQNHPGMCKHLIALARILIEKGF